MSQPLKIVDAHLHFYDHKINKHTFLDEHDLGFAAFVGDYTALPRKYLLDQYQEDTQNYKIEGIVWHEFLSTDPIKEAKWGQDLMQQAGYRRALVTLVDFLDPALEEKLEIYNTLPHITAIREHMVWSQDNPKKRFANRPDLLTDAIWQKQLALLNRYNFKCSLEVFAHQLPDLVKAIRHYPNIGFTIAVMGWPQDLGKEGYRHWKKELKEVSRFENTCLSISAIECIFGMDWTQDQIRPWLLDAIEMFGTQRCMFGSHMPIAKLSRSFTDLYDAYTSIVQAFTLSEKEDLFSKTASTWFRL